MRAFSLVVAGRRTKWVVLLATLLLVGAAASQAGKFEDAQENEPSSFLPDDSEALRALEAAPQFPSGRFIPAVIVYQRDGGLTGDDRREVSLDRTELNAQRPPGVFSAIGEPVVSEDGTTALLVADVVGTELQDATEEIRRRVGNAPPRIDVAVTGTAGFATDQVDALEALDRRLLLGTAALVLLLLVVIYRSPIFWAIPFVTVLLTEVSSRGVGYLLADAGVTVNGQAAAILVVLVFGAGTDYALLLMARYREELRRHRDKHEAMATAVRRAGPTIIASGSTVIAALMCLSLAELNATAGLGPVAATGIALAMLTMLTLLPALALVAGRRAFWPFVPRYASAGADDARGPWRRIGERIGRRPRRVWIGASAMLATMAVGLVWLNSDLTTGTGFREEVESVEGQQLLSEAFPDGRTAPTNVVVPDPERVDAVREAVDEAPGVATVGNVERGPPGTRFEVVLSDAPYEKEALDTVGRVDGVATEAAGGADVLLGGPTAEERDLRSSIARDNRVIVPLVLLVVLVILAVLLRAIVAPLLLMTTVILSFAAALGVGAFLFENVFGFEGMDPTLPLFAFIFLVALGVDYNIFLMARVREEALGYGTREGTLRGLAVTGGVITSAGIVLAGTFSILAVLPLVNLTELGLVIAFGVLLDTFIVRSILVPALVMDAGRLAWWPSRLFRRGGEGAPVPQHGGEALAATGRERVR